VSSTFNLQPQPDLSPLLNEIRESKEIYNVQPTNEQYTTPSSPLSPQPKTPTSHSRPRRISLDIHDTPDPIRASIHRALRRQQMVQIDTGLVAIGALDVGARAGGAERVAGAVGRVVGLVAGAEGAGVQVDGVRGGVHLVQV